MRKRPAISQLERHYSRILGELQKLAEEVVAAGVSGEALAVFQAPQVDERRGMLIHIEACLLLLEPSWTSELIGPVRARKARSPFDRGELLNMAYDVLRDVTQPTSTSDILKALWLTDRITRTQSQDTELRAALTALLQGQERAGAVASHGVRPLRWVIVRAPERC